MVERDSLAANYGDIPIKELQSKAVTSRVWTKVSSLTEDLIDQLVLVRGHVHGIRAFGENLAFLAVREGDYTVQCVVRVDANKGVSAQMVKYATGITGQSCVDVEGIVQLPTEPITGASQQVEIQVRKIHCVSRAAAIRLPITFEDASRSEVEFENLEVGKLLVHVNRVLNVQASAKQAIFRLASQVANLFRKFLLNKRFLEILPPKLIAGTTYQVGASQFHNQMAICGDLERVFVVAPVFMAEGSYMCEDACVDVEMEIMESYSEVMDIVDSLFVEMFDTLNETCQKELDAIGKQYPFKPLKYLPKTFRLTFEEGVQMLKEAGVEVDPLGDLNTESERTLGKLVLEKYGTEFYLLHRYPLAVRPFFTMPSYGEGAYSNSFDVYMRGEKIISGSQRIHVPELLESRAKECGIDIQTISEYINGFRYCAPPHGGFRAGLERILMLFCGRDSIRQTSVLPGDPRRLES